MSNRRVVVTGLGVVSPLGNNVASNWEAALAGKSGIAPIQRFDSTAFAAKIAGEIKNFDASAYLEPKEIKKHDLFSQYALAAAQEAWDDSALAGSSLNRSRIGCILGVGVGGLATIERYTEIMVKEGPRRISPFLVPSMISNIGPGNIAIRFGVRGVNFAITSACTSGTHAMGEACRMIATGVQDAILAGGAESAVTPLGIGGFCSMRALSTRNDEPTKASRPFDRDRDGFVMGEGAAVLVLESLDSAKARGAKIYAEVLGYGASCDAFHITAPCVDGAGAVSCMSLALETSGLKPEQIGYVNAHGTSTDANDVTETLAIKQVYGAWAKNGLLVSSTKSMTGHLLGAAGAVEGLFCVLALRDGIVPPTINLDNPAEGCDLDYVPHQARKVQLKAVMSNSFGFGGTNASIVFGAV
ncbi:MAG: beta-ketoacyl-ACP synthase II [Oligoflexia bacterium]|nr:beta-ketoacyl-ACP synthase II [Oligoflexia bacterium]